MKCKDFCCENCPLGSLKCLSGLSVRDENKTLEEILDSLNLPEEVNQAYKKVISKQNKK